MNKQNHSFLTGDFVDAFDNRQVCVLISHLKTAKPCLLDAAGRPRPITGNFSAVFRLQSSDGKIWAAKCFTRPQDNLAHRYQAIGTALAQLNAPWIVDFQYHEKGLIAGGRRAPMLVMQWVEGLNLREFVANNLNQPKLLRKLAKGLAKAIVKLEDAQLAHGDLQHGNILVQPDGEFFLIDYDGMFVPQLASQPPGEKGMRHYQSPLRQDDTYGPGLDRFSGWVICLSLLALAEAPDLWTSLRTGSDECLILRDDHFRDPSGVVAELRSRNRSRLDGVADQLEQILPLPLGQIPPLSELALTQQRNSEAAASSSSRKPSWMAKDPRPVEINGPTVSSVVNVPSTLSKALPHPPPPTNAQPTPPGAQGSKAAKNSTVSFIIFACALVYWSIGEIRSTFSSAGRSQRQQTSISKSDDSPVLTVSPVPINAIPKVVETATPIPEPPEGLSEVLGEPAEKFVQRLAQGEVVSISELRTSDLGANGSFISFSFKSDNPNVGITVRNPRNDPDAVLFSLSSEDWLPFLVACRKAPLASPAYGETEELFSRECLKGFPKPIGGKVRVLVSSSHTYDGISFGLTVEHLDFVKQADRPRAGRNWFAYWVDKRDTDEFLAMLDVCGGLVEALKDRRAR